MDEQVEKLRKKYESLYNETNDLKDKYEQKKEERDLIQTLMYCRDPGGLLLEHTTVSDKALRDIRFSIQARGKLIIHARSKVAVNNEPEDWELDLDNINNQIIIAHGAETQGRDDSWDDADDSNSEDDIGDNKRETKRYSMNDCPYRLAIPKFTKGQLNEKADMSDISMKDGEAISKLKFPVMLVTVSNDEISKSVSESLELPGHDIIKPEVLKIEHKSPKKHKKSKKDKKKDKKEKSKASPSKNNRSYSQSLPSPSTDEIKTLYPSMGSQLQSSISGVSKPQDIRDKLAQIRTKK